MDSWVTIFWIEENLHFDVYLISCLQKVDIQAYEKFVIRLTFKFVVHFYQQKNRKIVIQRKIMNPQYQDCW